MKRLTELSRKLASWMESLRGSEEGQTLIEYVLVLIVIVIGILAMWQLSGINTAMTSALSNIAAKITP